MKNQTLLFAHFFSIVIFAILTAMQPQNENFVSSYSKEDADIGRTTTLPTTLAFEKNDIIHGWIHTLGYVPFEGPKQFIPSLSGNYLITIEGNIRNNNIIDNISAPAKIRLSTYVNRVEIPGADYVVTLASQETKEFSHLFKLYVNKDDVIKFQMTGDRSTLTPKKTQSNGNFHLKTGESIRVTIKLIDKPSLRDLSVASYAAKIKSGEMTLEQAQKLLPEEELREKLTKLIWKT